ncbi:MAG: AAA family ATPase [Micrococcales bacterium]|nr:AAA family ATPase [Micrococcales bacterium]MCL2668696.1 AAA family ATPase [Micrococcales bacterium]
MSDDATLRELVPDAGGTIDWAGVLDEVDILAPLANTPQQPEFHGEGDVLIHTRMACEVMVDLPDYAQGSADDRLVLFYATLFHDLGKAACTIVEDGRISSAGHGRIGAIDARRWLWQAGVRFPLRERVCRLVRHHMEPFYAVAGNRAGDSAEYVVRMLSWELSIRDIAALAEADARGRICADMDESVAAVELFREVARDEGCYGTEYPYADAHTRLVYRRRHGAISVDHPFYATPGSHVVVMSGMPASGKNTWVARHAPDLPVVSFDDAVAELGLTHGRNTGAAAHLVTDRARELLRAREPFVWNATHLSSRVRARTLDLLYAYDAHVEVVYLESPEPVIKRRNTNRDTTLSNTALDQMLRRWEVPVPAEAHQVRYKISP